MYRLLIFALALVLAACNLSVPQVTPTPAPTLTPSQTPVLTVTQTPSQTPIATRTQAPTLTETATDLPTEIVQVLTETPSITPTDTLTPTLTPTDTPTDTPTVTLTPSDTPTGTLTPSDTPTLTLTPTGTLTPTLTATDTPTFTPPPTLTPSDTLTPSLTPTGTLTPSDTPTLTFTPSDTPTLTFTPSDTPTLTPTLTFTPSDTPTLTPTVTGTFTPVPTDTLTPTPTLTFTPSDTPTLTPTLTFTPSLTPTNTDTPAPTATNTPEPPTPTPLPTIGPSDTPTDTPTLTFTPSDTPSPTATDTPLPSATPRPTDTPLPTATPIPPTFTDTPPPTATETAAPSIRELLPSPLPTFTPLTPTLTALPLVTPTPPPTLDVTPTFIIENVAAPTPIQTVPPVPTETTPEIPQEQVIATFTPSPQGFDPQNNPTAGVPLVPTGLPLGVPGARDFALSTQNGLSVAAFELGIDNFETDLFAQNPANPNQFAVVNGAGQIFFVNDYANGGIQQLRLSFFTDFTFGVTQRDENNSAVRAIAWSPDGTLAVIIDGGDDLDTDKDGVWLWRPDGYERQLAHDCPPESGCWQVLNRGERPPGWQSVGVEWSPDAQGLIVQIVLPNEGGRRAFYIADQNTTPPDEIPRFIRAEYANWTLDSRRVTISGTWEDGTIVVGTLDRSGALLDARAAADLGLNWVRDAVELADGRIVALGTSNGRGSALSLVSYDGTRITEPIGIREPDRVEWSPDRRAVLVVIGNQYYVARTDTGSVDEITAQVADALTVEWVNSVPGLSAERASDPVTAPTNLPAAETVVEQPTQPEAIDASVDLGDFTPETEVRVRAEPISIYNDTSTESAALALLQPGTTLTIRTGAVVANGYNWYLVQTTDGLIGWVFSRTQDGYATLEATGAAGVVIDDNLPPTLADGFSPGEIVFVSTTGVVNLRVSPTTTQNNIIAQLGNGTQVVVQQGPQAAEGYEWYEVRTQDGQQGWIVATINGVDVLIRN